ncbi:MAG TPA: LLM class flavin-dependent oxidoreductase [Solirubrobacteraceae bacterium]|nr:LLM class flavin-dependent oxidoreductase [Solirubrobacteraceae bacterium]
MKFGIQNLFPAEGEDDHRVLLEALEDIKLADELCFDSAWLTEHHFSRYGILGNPLMVGAAVAETTKQIEIGTAVVVLPFHNPLRLAEDAATLDILSGGRLELGVGRGYQPKEFAGFGLGAETSKQRYAEVVEILKLAWTGRPFSFHGDYYSVDEVAVSPRPVRPGGPPIRHAVVSPASFPERGAAGDHIITSPTFAPLGRMKRNFDAYRTALIEAGHDPSDYDIPFMQQVWVGASEIHLQKVAESALAYYRTVGKVVPGSDEAIAAEAEYYEKVRQNIELLTLEQTLTHGGNFGSVDQVVDTIGRLATELGVSHYIGWFRIPSLERRLALKAMETFASEVIPQLRDLEPSPVVASV